jgi:uncharacterized hydrophobic protein (TIGR00271 family)
MLRLRMSVTAGQVEELVATLSDTHGVAEIVRLPVEGRPERFLLMADVTPAGADRVTTLIGALERGVEDLVLVHENVVAMPQFHPSVTRREAGFGWAEILGEARINSRPIARYLVMISAAAVIAGLGVITNNGILIVGAMAVSPDLLPICATCVGLVNRRLRLAGSALLTLQLGLALVAVISAGLTAALHLTGLIGDIAIGQNGLAGLAHTDYSTVLVALAAGVAAMISFETRASAAVGVAISVTTIPASAYLGVAFGLGEPAKAWGALLVLVVNVALLLFSGTTTLWVQARAAASTTPAR